MTSPSERVARKRLVALMPNTLDWLERVLEERTHRTCGAMDAGFTEDALREVRRAQALYAGENTDGVKLA